MHDLNSLYMLNSCSEVNITIIIVNDFGGGIFKTLPINNDKEYIDLLTTPHENSFKELINSFSNIEYKEVSTKTDFVETFTKFQELKKVTILEAKVNESSNLDVFEQLKTLKL